MKVSNYIKEFIEVNASNIIGLRREFHQIPELGFEEFKTSECIANYLENLGINVVKRIAKTGIVVDINENNSDYCIALRFDIDALPIWEDTGLPFSSIHKGKMHACGHDGHIAIGLGIANLINEIKDEIPSRVRLIFQPAEEGLGGAKSMVNNGVLKNPTPDVIIGFHIWPDLDTGEIGIRNGPIMSAGDRYKIKLIGKEGHGSKPHLAIDPTIMAAEVINGLQNIVGRNIDALEPVVISVGTINGGNSFNTIPSNVEITGTTRFQNSELREVIKNEIEGLVKGVTISHNGKYEFQYEECFDVTQSDPKLVSLLRSAIQENVGDIKVVELEKPTMVSEDFSEYEKYIPGIYFFIGTKDKHENSFYPLHNSRYTLDENTLLIAVEIISEFVFNLANKKGGMKI